ncbi:MAG: hypothetical protein QOK15_2508 [Nocardioidaceae bacterium]|nr:hypothetical protein [Nocardioidaceae bacterium]
MAEPLRYDDEELSYAFGPMTLARGREYHHRGRVIELDVNASNPRISLIHGRVLGSASRTYATTVTVAEDPSGLWVEARCTCPMVRMCKHAAALLLAAEEQYAEGRARVPEWERQLGLLLDELDDDAVRASAPKEPLALMVELSPLAPPTRFGPGPAERASRRSLRMRPVRKGAREKWIRTGVSWTDVPSLGNRPEFRPAQARVLAELLSAYRTEGLHSYYGSEAHLSLAEFGPSLWPLLAEADAVGLPLVPAAELQALRVAAEPVTLQIDLNSGDRDAQLQIGVQAEGEWFHGDSLELVGQAGHGVALWSPAPGGWEVVLAPLTSPAGARIRRLLAGGQPLAVPRERVDDLVTEYLPRLRRHLPVVSSDQSVTIPEAPPPRLVLTVTWKAVDEVHAAWSFRYRVGEDDRIYGLDETRGLRGLRRPEEEASLLDRLELDEEQRLRLCGSPRERRVLPEQTFRGAHAVAFVEGTLVPLEASGQVEIEEIGVRPTFQEVIDAPVIRFEPRGEDAGHAVDRTDWLDLEVVVTVGGRFIGLAQLLEAMTLGAERIVLRDGAHLRIDRPEFARLAELVHEARELEEQPTDGVRVAAHDLGLWDELAEIGLVDAQAARWVEAARALTELTNLPAVQPTGLRAELRHYQLEGFRWLAFLWEAGLGGVLADDMGLGKTLQTLALVAHARVTAAPSQKADRPGGPFLVVAPTSVVGIWAQEAATFTPGLTVRTVTQSRARRRTSLAELHEGADVVVTSYTLYRLEVDDYLALPWGGLVLDEAQTVKNHTGKTYQCVRRLETPFRLALTGTPMENRIMELWSLLSIVAPGLYPYPQRFAERVANPVEKEGDREVLDRFRRRIRPFLLRRTKDLVAADLPPKQEQVLEVQLTPKHRRIYDLHLQRERQKVLGLLGDFDRQRIAIFRSLTRLRQLSLDAGLVDEEYDGVGSAKLDALVDHLQEVLAEGHRALVFSQFTSFLGRVRHRLDAEGIESKYLDGRTRRRGDVIAGFKRGEGAVFLISLKAGGVGLTLTEADYVFVLDPWWNPAVEAQAVDRAHRIGQQRPVIVYRLVSTGTIEEKVMELKERKAALFARVLDGDGGMGTPIGADDVRALLAD